MPKKKVNIPPPVAKPPRKRPVTGMNKSTVKDAKPRKRRK